MALNLDVQWIHGAADCRQTTDPLLQTHEADAATFIFRQSKCSSFEGPFMYLLIGDAQALLLDTGAPIAGATRLPMREAVDAALARHGGGVTRLIVAHSHAHADHSAWDAQFGTRPKTIVVPHNQSDIQARFGIARWPDGTGTLDLGNRVLTVLPIPGHEAQHIAVFDARTGLLLTGDTVYPGLLVVGDWQAYRASAARLASFAQDHEIAVLLGAHVEMARSGRLFPIGSTFQPDEHPLPLFQDDLNRWTKACHDLGERPRTGQHAFTNFVIDIRE
jgi:glyoxylase-like metal-dependent hydrolase (beta-lactamase superfamily II)